MKTISLLGVLVVLISLSGCKYKNEALELQNKNKNLVVQLTKSDSLANIYRTTLKEIEVVLDSIIPEDNRLDPAPIEKRIRARLTHKVSELNGLLLDKDKNFTSLNYRLGKSNKMISEKSAMIEELKAQIMDQKMVISKLKLNVKKQEQTIAEKASQIELFIQDQKLLNEVLETKTNTLNSAYFIASSEGDLRDLEIIVKSGGFLGFLGRVNTLNPKLNRNLLQMIDIREKTSFTLNEEMRKIELISNHNPSSYELKDSGYKISLLTITDPVEFWKNSKNLVIAY